MDREDAPLVVVENAEQAADLPQGERSFVIYDEICEYDMDEAKSILRDFVRADVDSTFPYPVYRVLLPDFCERLGYARSSFIYGILLFDALSEYLNENDVSRVTTRGVDLFFRMVVLDACRQCGVETDVSAPRCRRANVVAYLSVLVSLVPFFVDQVFSLLYRYVADGPDSADTVVVVFPDRFDSIRPVMEEMDDPYEVITTPTTIAHLRSSKFSNIIDKYGASPMNLFVTPTALVAELRFLFGSVRRELVGSRLLERELRAFVSRQYGCELTYTSWWLVNDVVTGKNVESLLYYFVFDAAFDHLGCRRLVTNSFATKGRSILAAGDEHHLDQYHVPHSLFGAGFTPPPQRVTSFAPGSMEKEYISEQIEFVDHDEDFLVQGRPYVSEVYNDRDKYPVTDVRDDDDSLLITLATQPFEDEARRRLVEGVLAAIEQMDEQPTLLIKTHPSEDPSFYDAYRDAHDNVVVKSSDLFSVLAESDMVVVVNSNVGFETMLLGTPCFCFNQWQTMMWNMPYIQLGPVPVFASPAELGEYLASLTEEDLRSLSREQAEFVESNYILDGAAAGIADVIEDDSRAVTGRRGS